MAKRKEVINGLHNIFQVYTFDEYENGTEKNMYDISRISYEQSVDENTIIFAIADSEDVGRYITINGEPKIISENDNFIITDGVVFSGNGGGSSDVTNTGCEYTAGTNIDITGNAISAKGYVFDETLNSFAEGLKDSNSATGVSSHVEGLSSVAEGDYSHAEGLGTSASGTGSHTEGAYTAASGEYSHAEGADNSAEGNYSHAEGSGSVGLGICSHSEGCYTRAEGSCSHAEGSGSIGMGSYSHAEGSGSIGVGECSHTEGCFTRTEGNNSHAEGLLTTATGANSHAEGSGTNAIGTSSHAEGSGTTTNNLGEHAEGKYNISHSNTISSIGIGSSVNDRINALEVLNNGDLYIKGIGDYVGGTNGDPNIMENVLSLQTVISNIQEGVNDVKEIPITQTVYYGSNNIGISNNIITAKGYTCDATNNMHTDGSCDVRGDLSVNETFISRGYSNFNDNVFIGKSDTTTAVSIDATSGNITSSGTISAVNGFFETSDIRKKNVIDELPLDKAYELINNCQSIIYTLKDNTDKQHIGLIAQEVQQYFPEVVSENEDGYLSLDYAKLTSVIFRVLKDVIDRLSKLENK